MLFAALFAFAATVTAQAAYWDWKGKSNATSYFDDEDCWYASDSNAALSGSNHWFGYGKVTVANATVTSRNYYSLSGPVYVKGKTITFVAEVSTNGINSTADIEIGKDANATVAFKSGTYKFNKVLIGSSTSGNTGALTMDGGAFSTSGDVKMGSQGDATLTVNGGTMTVAKWTRFESSSKSKTINLNGGTLKTYTIAGFGGTGAMTVLFNGGTLYATSTHATHGLIDSGITAKVGAKGGTINAGGRNAYILADMVDGDSYPGALKFCGGGSVALTNSASVAYTGGTIIEAGTTIFVNNAAKKDAILGSALNTLKFIPTTSGTFTLVTITGDGTFADSDLLKVAVASCAAGTAVFSLSDDRKSLLATVTYGGGLINATTPTLVFPGATLADLATHTLRARFKDAEGGRSIDDDGMEATFFNRVETVEGGVLTKVTYQLQVIDKAHVKSAKVEFTADTDGVYAKLADGNWRNYSSTFSDFGTEPLSSNAGSGGYFPYDFRLVEPVANSISVNFTHTDGSDLDSDSSVRYGGGDYAIPYSAWANMPAGKSGTKTVGGATFNITKSSGQYRCCDLNKTKDLRYGYLDDGDLTVVVDVTDIPYEFYRIVTYHATDNADIKFGYVTINGVDYTGVTDATVKGSYSWGHTGARNKAKGLREGVNYLVSDVMIASSATITGHRDKSSGPTCRGCIAAIQIVEYVPTTYTATISVAGTANLGSLSWDNALPANIPMDSRLVINVDEDAAVNIPSDVNVRSVVFNVASGKTLTLSGNTIAAENVNVNGGKVVAGSASQLSGTVKGDGTLVYDGFKPAEVATFTDPAWTGTVWVKNIATDSEERKDWTLSNYGNAASTIRFTNVNLYFPSGTTSFAGTVDVDDAGLNICDGNAGSIVTIARLTGSGTLSTGGGSANGNGLTLNDVSGFTGTLSLTKYKVIIGTSTGTSASGVLQIDADQTVAIAAGKTWTAAYGVVLNGTLALGADAVAPAVVSGTGTVVATSGTGMLDGYGANATLTLATAPGTTLAITNDTLQAMTVGAFANRGTIDLTGTALAELNVTLAQDATEVEPGTILYPATLEKFVALPADQSIRSLDGFTAPTLPEGVTYHVQVPETREEYGKGSFTVTNVAEGVNVRVVRVADGSIVELTPEDGVVTISGAPLIAGAATAFDFTYTNTVDCAYQAPGLNIGRDWDDSKNTSMTYNNNAADKTTGAHIKHHPWVTGAGDLVHDLENFTIVLVGTMSPSHNTQFFHMGSSVNDNKNGLLIATTENDNEVLIAKNTGGAVDAANGVRASVPNAATARHAYVINKKGTVFEVWVDGVKRGQFDAGEGFQLAAGGIQVGSDHGGAIKNGGDYKAVPNEDTETGCLNVLRFFDYSISDAQAEAVFAEYPYVSQGGLYTRTVAANGTFSETDAWEKDGAEGTFVVPEGATVDEVYYNPSATLDVAAAATMTVNADVSLDTFTVGGVAPVSFASDGEHTISVLGAAVINSPVTNEYGAVYLAGAPVQFAPSGSICFDCSSLDVSEVYTVTRFQLTGFMGRDDEKVSCISPVNPDWSYELAYNASGSCYDLVVTPLRDYVVAENYNTSLSVTEDTTIVGAGGFHVEALSIPANGKLTFDPIKTPVYVSAAPTFGEGACLALSSGYAGMTLGRVVLMTWTGEAKLPENLNSLFDASSVAGSASVTTATAPNGTDTQLVLTVGEYDRDAKEIVVAAVGDSITQGVAAGRGDYPQYRTSIAAHLAANGYKPKFRGIWCKSNLDAAGVQAPDDWAYHSGFGYAAIRTTEKSGGLADNMPLYLDIAGYPDVITLLIGTNDMGANSKEAGETFANYVQLINATAAQRPNAKIVGATVLMRNDATNAKVMAFNELLRAEYEKPGKGDLPDNFFLVDLYQLAPYSAATYKDGVHPDWSADATIAEAFYGKIAEISPLATFAGAGDATVTDEEQTALGAANIADLAAYRAGMVHAFTIEKDGAAGATNCFTSAPYTYTTAATSVELTRPVSKVGYYMELVRKGTSRRRWVWVDMDATGMTLGEVDFPWNKANMQRIATKLHVKSNYAGIHDVAADDDSICGFVEGTMYNYQTPTNNIEGVPADIFGDKYGWNDTMGTSGGHACFQVHRIFSQTGADTSWNDAEVLFAWNKWGSDKAGYVDNIGIGTFACHVEAVSGGIKTTDYTFTENCKEGGFADAVTSDAYSIRRLEIWVKFKGSSTLIIR